MITSTRLKTAMAAPHDRRKHQWVAIVSIALLVGCAPGSRNGSPNQPATLHDPAQIALRCRCESGGGAWVLQYRVVNLGKDPVFIGEQLPISWTLHGLNAAGREVVWASGGGTVYGSSGYPSRYYLVRGAKEHVYETYTYLPRAQTMPFDFDEKMDPAKSYIECRVRVFVQRCASIKGEFIEASCHAAIPGGPADSPP